MRQLRNFSLLFVIMFWATLSQAQQFSGAVRFEGGVGVGEFREAAGSQFVPQVRLDGLYRLSNSPIEVGAVLGYGRYGTDLTRSNLVLQGVNQNFRIRRNNNLVHLNGVLRFAPELNSGIKPFLEGQAGIVHTYTRSRIRENRLAEPMSSGTELYDWSWMYQLGGGVSIPVVKNSLFLELSMHYVRTGEMEYLTRSGATYDADGGLSLQSIRSPFTMLQPGISLRHIF